MNEPTAFYRQHHAVDAPAIDDRAFRPYWRIRTRLDQLLIDGAIGYPVWRAGVSFRVLAEIVLAQQYPSKWFGTDRPENNRLGFDVAIAGRIDASNRLHAIRLALGGFAINLLEAHLVDDITWAALGERYGVHASTARRWTIVALQALAAVIWEKK